MKVTIYHNPRCGKSRETLQLLHKRDIETTVVEYLNTPPTTTELKGLLKKLGLKPRELMRTKEDIYKKLKLADPKLTDAQLIAAMVKHPILIERPIVIRGSKARLGRPPEQVLEIL